MCQRLLADARLQELLEQVDGDLAEQAYQAQHGQCRCGGKLHRGNYRRQPRGGPAHWDRRHSFCCAKEGCRKRLTPVSVRFLGRKVYVGLMVVLVSAMMHGLSPPRMQRLREELGIDRRTLQHWRQWWLERFAQSRFWKAARAAFTEPIAEATLPLSLRQCFARGRQGALNLLQFLSPITSRSAPEGWGM